MERIGKYEVVGERGTGSMGVIYHARDTTLDRDVALKTIVGSGALDPELKERFYREAKAGARLNHPNVVTVYEFGEQEGMLFIALELLSGCDLRQFINERRMLPAAAKIEVIAGVCDGLQCAHESGIIHRDIKPSNIFLTSEGIPKILDFGIARLSESQLTVLGRILGTPFYMAPEQILGKPCDARSDLFSLALVAFEFLTYAHPFAGTSIPKRIINDKPDSLIEKNPSLPAALEEVIVKALAKEPADRYSSAGEFAKALREVAAMTGDRSAGADIPETLPPPSWPPIQNANTEVKMSEILAALQEFDLAAEQSNVPAARAALVRIDRVAKVDDRFATAGAQSRSRLEDLEANLPKSTVVEPPPPVEIVASVPEPVAAPVSIATPSVSRPAVTEPPSSLQAPSNGSPGASPVGDGTSLFNADSSPAHVAAPVETLTKPAAPTATIPRDQKLTEPSAASDRQPAAPTRSTSKTLIVGTIAVALIVIGLGIFLILRPARVAAVPAVAGARIATDQAAIMSDPSDSATLVVNLRKGDSINVIRPPRSRTQEWTEVQFISGNRIYPVGTIKTSALTDWNSNKPDIALSLLEMNAPADNVGEADLRAYRQQIAGFLERFPSAPERGQAQADMDRIDAALARLTPSSPAKPAEKPAALDPAATLARAQHLWEQGQYRESERLLKQLLLEQPDSSDAKALLQRVQKARALEGGK